MKFPLLKAKFRPEGSISSIKELLDTYQNPQGTILYCVGQGGVIYKGIVYPTKEFLFTDLYSGIDWMEASSYFTGHLYFLDWNIIDAFYNRNFVFTDKDLAERYSKQLKEDVEYQNEVKRWHEWCKFQFGDMI